MYKSYFHKYDCFAFVAAILNSKFIVTKTFYYNEKIQKIKIKKT